MTVEGKKILVTGGAGFVGSHLVDALSSFNDVTVLDDQPVDSARNLERSIDRIQYVQGGIRDRELVRELVEDKDYIFHLAAKVSVEGSERDYVGYSRTNVGGTLALVNACKDIRKMFVYISSAAVYGETDCSPIKETHLLKPTSGYGETKRLAEECCLAYNHVYNVPVTILRLFNVYGERQKGNVIAECMDRIEKGSPLLIHGDGSQTRDFVHVSDVVNACILAATNPSAIGETFNVASGKSVSINKIVNLLVPNEDYAINRGKDREGDIKHSLADISKAREVLGFEPRVGIVEGLEILGG